MVLYTYWAVGLMVLYIILITIIYLPYLIVVDEKKGIEVTSRLKKQFGKFVIWLMGSKVEVIYEDRRDYDSIGDEPVVVVGNHQSFVDIPLILGYFPKNVGFVAKKEIRNWLIFNLWMDRAQCVFLDRSNPKKALSSMKEAMKFVKSGKSVAIFPEGTRTSDGNIGSFKKGSFKLAIEPGVRIVPITIKGTYDIMNKHAFRIKRGHDIKLVIGKSYVTEGINKELKTNIHNEIRENILKNLRGV